MPNTYHLDYETKSSVDLKNLGHYRYAQDCEILMFAIAEGDNEPLLWVNEKYLGAVPGHDNEPAFMMLAEAIMEDEALIYAHNAPFEIAISEYCMEKDIGLTPPPVEKWRDTAAMARKAALPSSLAKCGEALNLEQTKYAKGAVLMKMFSIPDKKTGGFSDPLEHPEDFQEYCKYCLIDVKSEQAVHKALEVFELKNLDLDAFLLYQNINHRGLPVDVETLKKAAEIVKEAEAIMAKEFVELTDLKHTQAVKLKQWMIDKGYPYDNLQASTVAKAIKRADKWCDDPDVMMALYLRQQLSFAAFKKIDTMINCACDDNRVRGSLMWYGAHTGRGSGRLMQPQNFKRPTIKNTEEIYARLQAGELDRDTMEKEYGNPLEVVSSCIRHFIHAEDGGVFIDADYAAIEARIVAWLGDQTDVLEEYKNGIDAYVAMATKIFNCSYDEQIERKNAGESTVERFVGKQAVLGCGFQMGVPRFLDTCNNFGFSIPREQVENYMEACGMTDYKQAEDFIKTDLAETAVRAYREKHNGVAALWKKTEQAAISAISNPGQVFEAGSKLKFQVIPAAGMHYLIMQLPSGRCIAYPKPMLDKRENGRGQVVKYWAKLPGKELWGHVSTYGGKLVENATQGVAADVMACGSCVAEKAGYKIATLIHDEALAFKTCDTQNIDEFCDKLVELPSWAKGLPVEAEGYETPYYKK